MTAQLRRAMDMIFQGWSMSMLVPGEAAVIDDIVEE